MKFTGLVLLLLVLVVLAIIFGPLLAIWSINTLFTLTIAYSLKNWFAMLLLMMLFGKSGVSVKKSN